MQEILKSIDGVTTTMSEITAASDEQAQGIEEINFALTRMDDATQQNAALVEEAAAAAKSLEEQTRNLAATIGSFRIYP